MTIDEAIEQEKFKARVDRIKANKRIFHNNDEDEISACHRSAEKHEQLAEWLEELKAYREIGTVEECKGCVLEILEAYNKAIDDFKSRLEERILAGKMIDEKFAYIDNCDIDEIVEQLKAGGENEQSI